MTAASPDRPSADVTAAIRTVEKSRRTHTDWRDHLAACAHCQENPPANVHDHEEQDRIIAEYDNVLAVLRLAGEDYNA